MDSALTTVGLPIALAIIMFGLGLSLTPDDFRRVGRHPRAVAVALACQLLLLPAVCFGLVKLFDLPPLLAIGMMLLAASPGGTSANLFSHLFRGDVALNVTLTAINSIIAIVSLPFITNLAIAHYDQSDTVSLQFGKVVEVFAIVLVPVALGMLVRAKAPAFAARTDKGVRIGSAVILAVLVVGILLDQRENVGDYLADVGLVAALFCAASLVVGLRDPQGARHRRGSGDRVVDGDRGAQRDAGDLRRGRGARGHGDLDPGSGLLALHVRLRGGVGVVHQPAASALPSRRADARASGEDTGRRKRSQGGPL